MREGGRDVSWSEFFKSKIDETRKRIIANMEDERYTF